MRATPHTIIPQQKQDRHIIELSCLESVHWTKPDLPRYAYLLCRCGHSLIIIQSQDYAMFSDFDEEDIAEGLFSVMYCAIQGCKAHDESSASRVEGILSECGHLGPKTWS